ncbi:transketolase [Candidatus Dependentiae bacterium]|nr:transketolase [Candidatus Dependentiae bacterium]
MTHTKTPIPFLEHKAYLLRKLSLEMTTKAGSGHPTSCLSAADLVAALFFAAMQYDPANVNNGNNDRFILSKGHASPLLYGAWYELGMVSYADLMSYRTFASALEGHPTFRFPYTQAATGSLGIGLSIGAGMALHAQRNNKVFRTYVLMGDAEIAEGSVWEATELASFYKLNNLIAIVDCNRLGQSTQSIHGHAIKRYADQFQAFGWNVISINGHDMQEIVTALATARAHDMAPTVILAKTFKGHGVSPLENKEGFHGIPCSTSQLPHALEQLKDFFWQAATYTSDFVWQSTPPIEKNSKEDWPLTAITIDKSAYKKDELIATRKAYGQALVALGQASDAIVVLDAEVKNSTYAQLFEDQFPERFVQCFIAEQNMVSMGVGFDLCQEIPFISTFASFFSRAHDQIRMAAIGQARLRLVGSHAGVSIGQDGPSQMGLEDIALARALPDSIVLYPADAVSTHALTEKMANYTAGISYMRTTRMATPVLYDADDTFSIGGCKVLRQHAKAQVCIIAAGITLYEALKAHDQLQEEGIQICVIDLYSIKPLDTNTLATMVAQSGNRFITVEDHYLQGGLGEAVLYALRNSDARSTCLAVTKLPRSGTPEELLGWARVDARAIVQAVHELMS